MIHNIHEKELDILRDAVSKIDKKTGTKKMQSIEVKKILIIVEKFIINDKNTNNINSLYFFIFINYNFKKNTHIIYYDIY